MVETKNKFIQFKKNFENHEKELEYNKSILNELEILKPQENEENELIDKRLLISNSAKILNTVNDALNKFNGDDSISWFNIIVALYKCFKYEQSLLLEIINRTQSWLTNEDIHKKIDTKPLAPQKSTQTLIHSTQTEKRKKRSIVFPCKKGRIYELGKD